MKRHFILGCRNWAPIGCAWLLALTSGVLAAAKDKSDTYQLGTYIATNGVADGTITDNFNCGSATLGSTVCSGGVHANGVMVYQVKATNGTWFLETFRQAEDSTSRTVLGQEPVHFKAEKANPLDLLKSGDRVLFRVEMHRKLIGTETDVFIPYADNPNKEAKFVGTFTPDVVPAEPKQPTDNVQAMCDAHKLSADLEKQLCMPSQQAAMPVASNSVAQASVSTADSSRAQVPRSSQESAQMVQDGLASVCAVITVPTGAEIYVDGERGGTTPMVFFLMKHGDTPRVVTIKLDGYKAIERQFVPDGKPISLGLTLERETSSTK